MKEVLDFLQTVYPVRLNPKDIPSSLRSPFDKAASRFQKSDALKTFDRSKMGICEEVADLTYQVMKLICLEKDILNEKTIRTLQDHLEQNHYYDPEGKLVGLDYMGLDALSLTLVPESMIRDLRGELTDDFSFIIIRDFLGGQFIAYISRIWRGHAMGGLQAAEHMRNRKIPEEARELIEALIKSSEKLTGDPLMEDMRLNLDLADQLFCHVRYAKDSGDCHLLLNDLPVILKKKIAKPVTVEDTLHLMFLKMKGRQELDFIGVPEQEMRYICKPAEYLIEADMFF